MTGGNWTPALPLEPATQYYWEVFAGIGTTFGPPSPLRSFFTGPECEMPAELKTADAAHTGGWRCG